MSAGEAERFGGCLCGVVRYRIALPPLWVAHCHCSICRRAQGAGFVTWARRQIEQWQWATQSGGRAIR